MPRSLFRITAVGLMLCLVGDPATLAAFSFSALPTKKKESAQPLFQEQALVGQLLNALHPLMELAPRLELLALASGLAAASETALWAAALLPLRFTIRKDEESDSKRRVMMQLRKEETKNYIRTLNKHRAEMRSRKRGVDSAEGSRLAKAGAPRLEQLRREAREAGVPLISLVEPDAPIDSAKEFAGRDPSSEQLAQNVQVLIVQKNLNRVRLAENLGVSASAITHFLDHLSQGHIRIDALYRMKQALGVSWNDLFYVDKGFKGDGFPVLRRSLSKSRGWRGHSSEDEEFSDVIGHDPLRGEARGVELRNRRLPARSLRHSAVHDVFPSPRLQARRVLSAA